jgi:hypothetical protein
MVDLEELTVEWRIMLKWSSRNDMGRTELNSSCLGQGQVAGCGEHDSETAVVGNMTVKLRFP